MMKLLIVIWSVIATALPSYVADIAALDNCLEKKAEISSLHDSKIGLCLSMISKKDISSLQQYGLYDQLYSLSFSYQFDQALSAANGKLAAAREIGDSNLINDAVLDKAMLLCVAGYHMESRRVIEDAKLTEQDMSPEQQLKYLYYLQRLSIDSNDVSNDGRHGYVAMSREYRKRIVDSTPEDSRIHLEMATLLASSMKDYRLADSLACLWVNCVDYMSVDYSVATFYRGHIQERLGNDDAAIHWYSESACSDIENAVKDNASICCLSRMLLKRGDVDRAFQYVQAALSDALFFNARLRPLQIARYLPSIEAAYNQKMEENQKRIGTTNRVIFSLSIVLLLFLLMMLLLNVRTVRANREITRLSTSLKEANERLSKSLKDVSEANSAKEEYLGLFLSMCSSYLVKLKKHQSLKESEKEFQDFYDSFDNAFLHLYPSFVEDFNALLKPECRIELKKGALLNTELRIFALIKLGITQSSHIASLLRYSVNTIYNYRAQIKNDSICREDFEERVKSIGYGD